MDTKTYQVTKVTSHQSDCNLKFDVITSSIDTFVAGLVDEFDVKSSAENTEIRTITDNIMDMDNEKQVLNIKIK